MTPKFRIQCYVCTDSMGHSARVHETLEILDEMMDSLEHPEQSSTEQGRAKASKVASCLVKCWIRLTRALYKSNHERRKQQNKRYEFLHSSKQNPRKPKKNLHACKPRQSRMQTASVHMQVAPVHMQTAPVRMQTANISSLVFTPFQTAKDGSQKRILK